MRFIELLDDIDPNWSVKEKVKKLYNEICKNIIYDERFMYSQNEELLYSIYNREPDINEDEETRFVCRTANKIFLQLLQELGIKAQLIYKNSSVKRPIDIEDVALVFWDEDGNKYYTNIVGDIQNCRYGLRTEYFGITRHLYEEAQDVKEIGKDELEQIDLKTGCIKHGYTNMVFTLLIDEVKNTNNFKKFLKGEGINADNLTHEQILQNKMQYLTRLIKFRDMTAGEDERKQFYRKLFCASALDKFESKKFDAYEFIKEDEDGEIDCLSVIQINLSEGPVYYIYSSDEQTYVQISSADIKETVNGYRERKNRKLLVQEDAEREEKTEEDIIH